MFTPSKINVQKRKQDKNTMERFLIIYKDRTKAMSTVPAHNFLLNGKRNEQGIAVGSLSDSSDVLFWSSFPIWISHKWTK